MLVVVVSRRPSLFVVMYGGQLPNLFNIVGHFVHHDANVVKKCSPDVWAWPSSKGSNKPVHSLLSIKEINLPFKVLLQVASKAQLLLKTIAVSDCRGEPRCYKEGVTKSIA